MKKTNPLVSILCPCYNSELYIDRMIESVLNQTYKKIELICIDDGSTDATVDRIEAYYKRFEAAGMILVCLKREHRGQAAAVNSGLKIMHGDYFCLIDSDDFYKNSSIEKRVKILENNFDYAVVVSDYYIVHENNLKEIIGKGNDYIGNLCYQPNQFYLALAGYSSITPVGYMIRTRAFKTINPELEINECPEGQNYQILLPLYYNYKRYYTEEALGYYVVRDGSHGHSKRNLDEIHLRYQNLLRMLEEVFRDMGIDELEIKRLINVSFFNTFLEG